MNKLLILFVMLLSSCGSQSLLSGKTVSFPQNGDVVILSTNNTYIETSSLCNDAGEWNDLNAGSSSGKLCVKVLTASAIACGYANKVISYQYVIAGETVDIYSPVVSDSDCNF